MVVALLQPFVSVSSIIVIDHLLNLEGILGIEGKIPMGIVGSAVKCAKLKSPIEHKANKYFADIMRILPGEGQGSDQPNLSESTITTVLMQGNRYLLRRTVFSFIGRSASSASNFSLFWLR